jgi:hypothetical protein
MVGRGNPVARAAVRTACLAATVGIIGASVAGCGARAADPGHGERASARHPAPAAASRRTINPAAWAKAQAQAIARRMLADQKAPPGTRPFGPMQHWPWVLQLPVNINQPGHSVRVGRGYLVPRPLAAVLGFLRHHIPAGTIEDAYSSGPSSQPEQYDSYRLAAEPDGVSGTLFVAAVAPDGPHRTWLRLDAMVDWTLPRTAAEHIDASRYRAVVLTGFEYSSRKTVTRSVTDPSVIAELARQLNAMHTAGYGPYNCEEFSGGDELIFKPKSGQAPVVKVQQEPCYFLGITVGGKTQPSLAGAGYLLRLVSRLTGTR